MHCVAVHHTPGRKGALILEKLKEVLPKGTIFFNLEKEQLRPCVGCFGCWTKTPGLCFHNDGARRIMEAELQSQRVIHLCPVVWGAPSTEMKIFQDRSIGKSLPFFIKHQGLTAHPSRYDEKGSFQLVGYGSELTEEEAELFIRIGEKMNPKGRKPLVLREEENFYAPLVRFLEEEER